MAGTLDALYDYDSGQIDALCGAYRGAGPLQRPFYTSPDVFKADMERIWRRHWLYAGHTCLIANPGIGSDAGAQVAPDAGAQVAPDAGMQAAPDAGI